MIKKFKNIFTGSIFTATDVDIATAKYFGIFEFANGVIQKGLASPAELNADNYFEIK
jgi:hypothetical protein